MGNTRYSELVVRGDVKHGYYTSFSMKRDRTLSLEMLDNETQRLKKGNKTMTHSILFVGRVEISVSEGRGITHNLPFSTIHFSKDSFFEYKSFHTIILFLMCLS